jgi:hypothetical protein
MRSRLRGAQNNPCQKRAREQVFKRAAISECLFLLCNVDERGYQTAPASLPRIQFSQPQGPIGKNPHVIFELVRRLPPNATRAAPATMALPPGASPKTKNTTT